MASWDHRSAKSNGALRNRALRTQLADLDALSPLWQRRFSESNRDPTSLRTPAELAGLPALGERDVSPAATARQMADLVVRGTETDHVQLAGVARLLHSGWLRLNDRSAYRREVDADLRATTFSWTGLGFTWPVASTRHDLDVLARSGARLWQVLGLGRDDVLVGALDPSGTEHRALSLAALGAGAPAAFLDGDPDALAAAVEVLPPTVIAVPSDRVDELVGALRGQSQLRMLLLVGAPDDAERAGGVAVLQRCGAAADAVVLAVHVPSGGRVMWGECAPSGGASGFHTYPDLDVVHTVGLDTGEPQPAGEELPGELVLTQLGMRGSALLRWRSGDLLTGLSDEPCPACGRRLTRLTGLRRRAAVAMVERPGEPARALDLRAAAGALFADPEVDDWRLVLSRRRRTGEDQVSAHVVTTGPAEQVRDVLARVRDTTGGRLSQVVSVRREELARLDGAASGRRAARVLELGERHTLT